LCLSTEEEEKQRRTECGRQEEEEKLSYSLSHRAFFSERYREREVLRIG
jgi:hypothetical protein